MHDIELKLRFQLSSPLKQEKLVELLKNHLSKDENKTHGSCLKNHATINLPKNKQHIWSPHLGLDFEETPTGTLIKGAFGPKPSIWLFFMFIYITCGFIIIFGATIGFSQYTMNKTPYGFYPIPICLIISIGVYLGSRYGKIKSKPQMVDLMNFTLETLQLK